jgi:hypothetical protein
MRLTDRPVPSCWFGGSKHFQITNITGGTLYLNDGVTQLTNGQFITVAQGAAGLKFTPAANSLTSGSFTVQASTSATTARGIAEGAHIDSAAVGNRFLQERAVRVAGINSRGVWRNVEIVVGAVVHPIAVSNHLVRSCRVYELRIAVDSVLIESHLVIPFVQVRE